MVRWTSTFNHVTRRQRAERDHTIDVADGYRIKMLHGPGYTKNVSLRRLVDHIVIARKFRKLASWEPIPDIILCSMPTIELSAAAIEYGAERGIPVVLDIRDLWPDIFLEVIPQWLQAAGTLLLAPMFRSVGNSCRNATALFSITPAILEWGLKYAGRTRAAYDGVFYHGYKSEPPDAESVQNANDFWDRQGITEKGNKFIVSFFGYFGRQFEFETVIRAAASLEAQHEGFLFVLCGDGDRLTEYRKLAYRSPNIMFPGFIGRAEIWTLMRRSSVGLAPYKNDFPDSIPNKAIEYFSAGLPVVSSLQGTMRQLLANHDCGVTYANGKPEELACVLRHLRDSPSQLLNMSERALDVFREKFVADKVYGETAHHLEQIAAAYRKGGGALSSTSRQRCGLV